ncbi:C40 family peptidase [Cohnella sp. REN36]|uniref:C40 family peptidase n=1 Tax=Cohnella sp. REN36 TaxID=2887347 RepID=UPI00351D8CBD
MNRNIALPIRKSFIGIGLSLTLALGTGAIAAPASAFAAQSQQSASAATVANQIIATGKQYLGVPYVFGASSGKTSEFDCSSFTQYVYGKHGIDLPRTSQAQSKVGTKVSKSDLQPGDLVFSDTNRDGKVNHVSIYMGGGQLLHTYRVGIGVTISDFAGSTWDKTFVTARRVIPDGGAGQAAADTSAKKTPSASPSSSDNGSKSSSGTGSKAPTGSGSKDKSGSGSSSSPDRGSSSNSRWGGPSGDSSSPFGFGFDRGSQQFGWPNGGFFGF